MQDNELPAKIEALTGKKPVIMSAIIHSGTEELIKTMYAELRKLPPVTPLEYEPFEYSKPDKESFSVVECDDGSFEVFGGLVDEIARNVVLDNYDSMQFFQRRIKETGIDKALRNAGVKDGDTVRIKDIEFEYYE